MTKERMACVAERVDNVGLVPVISGIMNDRNGTRAVFFKLSVPSFSIIKLFPQSSSLQKLNDCILPLGLFELVLYLTRKITL